MWQPTFAVSRTQFYCGQNFQPKQFCWQVNKTAYLGSYTEAFRSSGRKTVQNCQPWQLHGGFSVQREFCSPTELPYIAVSRSLWKCQENWFYAIFKVTVKLLYMEVLLVSKILAGPKTLRVTSKVSSFEPFFSRWTEKPPCNCQGMQFCCHVNKTALVGSSDRTKIVTVKLLRLAVTWWLYKTAVYGCYSQVYTHRPF